MAKKFNFEPREWQTQCFAKAMLWLVTLATDRHFLINATPGAGKTLMASWLAKELIERGLIDRVIVIAPRNEVVRKWAEDFLLMTGRRMMKITSAASQLLEIQPDLCANWQAVSSMLPEMQAICRNARTLVICDEHHHAAMAAAWGSGAEGAFEDAKYVICLTGTPMRSDRMGLVWFDTDEKGKLCIPEAGSYTLGYKEAVLAGYCRPMTFHRHPGEFAIKLFEDEVVIVRPGEATVTSLEGPVGALVEKECTLGKMVRTAHRGLDHKPVMPSYHQSMVVWANQKLDDLRAKLPGHGGLANAGAMVVAPSKAMADYFAELIGMIEGKAPLVVYSGMPGNDQVIEAFRNGTSRWLVSVAMVSEGVDIPRLRVIINLSLGETELLFRQLCGRAIRTTGETDCTRAYMVIPEIDSFTSFARNYEEEQGLVQDVEGPRVEPPPTSPWACKECGALNSTRSRSCHECGTPRPVTGGGTPLPPVFEYSIVQAMGERNGVIARGIELSEASTLDGESITAKIIEFDQLISPGTAAQVLKNWVPEQLGWLPEFAEWYRKTKAPTEETES